MSARYKRAELQSLPRRELQAIAKEKGMDARGSNLSLITSLTGKSKPIALSMALANQTVLDLPSNVTGQAVTPTTSLSVAGCWACVRVIADTISTLGLYFKQRIDAASKFVTTDIRNRLVNQSPNPEMSSQEFWSQMAVSLCTSGNAFAEIVRTQGGQLVALYPLQPFFVQAIREPDGIHYWIAGQPVQQFDLLHIKLMTLPGNIFGISPVTAMRQAIGKMLAQDESQALLWRNAGRPGGILSTQSVLSDKARDNLQKAMASTVQGLNQGKMMVLEEGLTYNPVGWSPLDLQMIEQAKWDLQTCARMWGVPPSKIGDSSAKFSNQEQENLNYISDCLRPLCHRIEAELNFKLCSDNPSYYFQFNLDELFYRSSDMQTRASVAARLQQWGITSANESRTMFFGLEPRPEPAADALLTPANWKNVSDQDVSDQAPQDNIDKTLGIDSSLQGGSQ